MEPDITNPPADVLAEQVKLAAAVAQAVPGKQLNKNLLLATWNLRAFGGLTKDWQSREGDSPKRNFRDVRFVAEIVSHFDVIAIQEVRGDLRALRHLLKALGPQWGFLLTDVTKGPAGNNERLAFLYDSRRVKPSGLACELVVWIETESPEITSGALNRQFARTPYACSFVTTGAQPGATFILVTLHVDWGSRAADRVPELTEIANWLGDWAEKEDDWKHNVIALGDFNIDREGTTLYDAFTSTGLTPAPGLAALRRTIFDKPKKTHYYDQIAWFTEGTKKRPVLTLSYSCANHVDFVPQLQGDLSLTSLSWHISDHYPLWVEFALPTP